MRVLVVNAGSSSLKLRTLGRADQVEASNDLGPVDDMPPGQLESVLEEMMPFDAAGHRIVHGGTRFSAPVRLDDATRRHLDEVIDLAPLHNAPALAAVDAVSRVAPTVPSVACFDTAFHHGMPPEATTYAVPRSWRQEWGVRRFGFHGLSHAYASRVAAEYLRPTRRDAFRVVTCHLGSGASLAAVLGGRCIDTTMGFTPLEGLVMATRSGSVDPGLVLWLQMSRGLTAEEVLDALEHASGLVGLAGSADVRDVIERADAGDADATLALAVYVHRLRSGIAAMVASLGGIDALVFTGGVGEHVPAVRAGAVQGLTFLGVGIDHERNLEAPKEIDIGASTSTVRVLVIEAREDVEIARAVRHVLAAP